MPGLDWIFNGLSQNSTRSNGAGRAGSSNASPLKSVTSGGTAVLRRDTFEGGARRVGIGDLNAFRMTALVGRSFAMLGAAQKLPSQTALAISELRRAIRTGQQDDFNTALEAGAVAARDAVVLARGALGTAVDTHVMSTTFYAALRTLKASGISSREATRLAVRATRLAYSGADLEEGLAKLASKRGMTLGHALQGSANRAAATAASDALFKSTGKAAAEAAGRVMSTTLAGALKRFTPGLNESLAVFDSVNALTTLHDAQASVGRKITSSITAAGSIAAATNIPGLATAGSAVSVVSGLLQNFLFKR